MKRILTLLTVVLSAVTLNAQYYYLPSTTNGNPGGLNADSEYPVGGGLSTTWTSISSPGASTPNGRASTPSRSALTSTVRQ